MIGSKGIDTGFMEKLFGSKFAIDRRDKVHTVTFTAAGEKFLGIPAGKKFVLPKEAAPVFFPAKADEVLAYTGDGKIALALKKSSGAALIWSALPRLDADMISGMAKRAGLPTVDCVPRVPVWFNRGVLAIHTAKNVKVSFDFGKYGWQLENWEDGKRYSGKVKLDLSPETTVLFKLSGKK